MAKKSEKETYELTKPKNIVKTNHEFLFLYDAKLTNPNGDPDNENKPRMDEERELNIATDTRLKRYIRDYLYYFLGKNIFVKKLNENSATPGKILTDLENSLEANKVEYENHKDFLKDLYLKNFIDMRMFGATIAVDKKKMNLTGPIQLNWGYSLNKVSLNESNSITTTFASGENKSQGSMGNDYRVNYSLLAFYGNIIANKCEHTLLTDDDIKLFDEAIIKSIPLLSTRSKIGQYPRFYLRLEYNENHKNYLYGDLRNLLSLEEIDNGLIKLPNIRNASEFVLNTNRLKSVIDKMKEEKMLKNISYYVSDELNTKDSEFSKETYYDVHKQSRSDENKFEQIEDVKDPLKNYCSNIKLDNEIKADIETTPE